LYARHTQPSQGKREENVDAYRIVGRIGVAVSRKELKEEKVREPVREVRTAKGQESSKLPTVTPEMNILDLVLRVLIYTMECISISPTVTTPTHL
jgi:hypothetical protein